MDGYGVNQDLTHRVPDNSLIAMRMKKFRNESKNAANSARCHTKIRRFTITNAIGMFMNKEWALNAQLRATGACDKMKIVVE